MSEEKQGWKWWQKLGLAIALLLFILIAALVGMRRPWIEPVPGVRITMTRPFVREADLGPDSAYRLLLAAIEEPAEAPPEEAPTEPAELFAPEPDPEKGWPPVEEVLPEPEPVRIWEYGWSDALTKFKHHPWPAEPPPAHVEDPFSEELGEDECLDTDDQEAEVEVVDEGTIGQEDDEWMEDEDAIDQEDDEWSGGGADLDMFGMYGGDPTLAPEAPWTLAQYQDIERLVKLYEPKMALLDQALAAPNPQVPTADSVDFVLPYLQPARELARWLAVSAHYRAAHEDYDGAFQDLDRIVRMGNLISRGGVVINHLVNVACCAIAADAAWVIATRHDIPVSDLKREAQRFLAADDAIEPYAEAVRADAAFIRSAVTRVYRQASLDFDGGGFVPGSDLPIGIRRVGFVLVRLAGSTPENTVRNMDACYQHVIQLAEQPYSEAIQKQYNDLWNTLQAPQADPKQLIFQTRDPIGLLLANSFFPYLDQAHKKAAHHHAILRGMALFLAIKAYEKEHGVPPETLDQLVPDYLPAVPADPFGGAPFHYLRNNVPGVPPEAWAVYSVGTDLIDSRGSARSVGSPRGEMGNNDDLVWPSQDYLPPDLESDEGDMFGSPFGDD